MSIFLDANVLVYWVDKHPYAERVEELLEGDCVISAQVLNEFANVLRGKRKMLWPEIGMISLTLQGICKVCDLTLSTHNLAVYLGERYQFNIFDANIVAAAAAMRCAVVYSEDMQHGLNVKIPAQYGGNSLSIKNPFL